jgi:hypothetical protein
MLAGQEECQDHAKDFSRTTICSERKSGFSGKPIRIVIKTGTGIFSRTVCTAKKKGKFPT